MKLIRKDGFSDWRHLAIHLSRHETTTEYIKNFKKLLELRKRLDENLIVDFEQQRYFGRKRKSWRDIIT